MNGKVYLVPFLMSDLLKADPHFSSFGRRRARLPSEHALEQQSMRTGQACWSPTATTASGGRPYLNALPLINRLICFTLRPMGKSQAWLRLVGESLWGMQIEQWTNITKYKERDDKHYFELVGLMSKLC